MDFTIGIDIGGTNFRIGMVGRDGEIINFEKNSSRISQSTFSVVGIEIKYRR